MSILDSPSGETCQECNTRPATKWWTEGAMAAIHGAYSPICDYCATEKQLAHAREMAARIPELERTLADLGTNDVSAPTEGEK